MSFDLKLVNGDLVINGDVEVVEDGDKLVQDVLKLVSTQLGTNPFFPAYGSPISQFMVGRTFDEEFMENVATDQLRSSIERLQELQLDQLRKNQVVTPDEQIAAIQDVRISQSKSDPRYFLVNLTVISKAFKSHYIDFVVGGN